VARINPAKTKQEAEKLEKAGRLDQSIALYRQIIDDNPLDWNTINKVGDLYAKLNRNREAAVEYAKVADYYAKDGFLLKAIAIWKKINKLDATALDPYVNLAELYAKQGLMMEAKGQYQIIVDEYVRRGKLRDAGEILRRMADIDPGDLKIRSKLADLYTREGNATRAVEEHIAIADELNKKGHLAEALQVLEKGLKIGPQNPRLRAELARIHLLQKNYDKAVHFLEETIQSSPNDIPLLSRLGEAYLGAKKIDEAQSVFRRLIDLNPSDQEARVQMGRLFLVQGQFDRAFDELHPVIERLLEQREGERAIALLQQILQRNPSHIKSLLRLAEIYRAIGKDDLVPGAYSQLTEACIKEGQLQQAASILETLTSMEPQNQQHRTKLAFVRERLAGGPAPARPTAAPPPRSSFEIEEEEEFDLDQPVPFGTTVLHGSAPVAPSAPFVPFAPRPDTGPKTPIPRPPAIEASGPLSSEDREFLDEHMAEGRVFRKYGLTDKAFDQFEAIVARFPDHVDARRELLDLYREKGPADKALEHCLALAEAYRLRGDASAADACSAEAKSLRAAGAPAAKAMAAPAHVRQAPAAPPRPSQRPPEPEPHEDIPIDVDMLGLAEAAAPEEESVLSGLDLGQDAEGLPDRFLDMDAPAASAGPDSEEFDLSAPGGLELTPARAAPAPLAAPPPFAAAPPSEDLDFSLPVEEEVEIPLPTIEPPPAPRRAAAPQPPPPFEDDVLGDLNALEFQVPPPLMPPPGRTPAPAASLPPDLAKAFASIDQSLAFGFVDEARDALRSIGSRYPGHPAILEKIDQLGLDGETAGEMPEEEASVDLSSLAAPASAAAAPPLSAFGDLGLPEPEPAATFTAPPESAPFDLGAEMDDLFGAQAAVQQSGAPAAETELGDPGLVQIFEEFRRGVDQQLGSEDYDTRYNLGIAYKEMGLIDEAIAEFQLAAKDAQRLLECSSMLGLCFMEKGMPKLAVKWFEKGLKAPGRLEEEYNGLRYDLAMAHEAAGENETALRVYSDLYGHDASFRDVTAKVRELKSRR
jgi:pilus assembly protein FimV